MNARGGEPENDVAFGDIGARQHFAAFDRADRETREIVIVAAIEPGHLSGFAADQRTARLTATD